MRVTQSNVYRTATSDMMRLQYNSFQIDRQIYLQNKVNAPSDAPSQSVTILDSRHTLNEISQYNSNLSLSKLWLGTSESTMQSIVDKFTSAKVLAEQMSTGTYDLNQRKSTASEIQNILEQIITLSNKRIDGNYIFAGSNTKNKPNTANILETNYGPGHAAEATSYKNSDGYHLQLARDDTGALARFLLGTSNTLGSSLAAPLDFNSWTVVQESQANPDKGEISYNNAFVARLSDLVSRQVGEELTFQGDDHGGELSNRTNWALTVEGPCTVRVGTEPPYVVANAQDLVNQINTNSNEYRAWQEGSDKVHIEPISTGVFEVEEVGFSGNLTVERDQSAGGQTFRTEGLIQVTGPGSVTIGGDTYPPAPATSFNDASQLVEMINSDSTRNYFAYLEGDYTVHVVSKGKGGFDIGNATGEVAPKDTTTMQELIDTINKGVHAAGVMQISSTPLDTDTITVGDQTWTWEEIKGSQSPVTPEEHANVLASWISSHSDKFEATVSESGSRPTVQVMARAPGKAGNVKLIASGTAVNSSGALFGGLDPTELNPITSSPKAQGPSTLLSDSAQGHGTLSQLVYASGNYHLRLSRNTTGADATLQIDPATNLGLTTPMAGINFSPGLPNWQIDQMAGAGVSEIMTNWSTNLPSITSPVSDRVGEVLSWTSDPSQGKNTFRTQTTVNFTGPAGGANTTTISIGGVNHTISGADAVQSAADLVDWMNSPTGLNDNRYFAYLDGNDTVKIMAKDGAPPVTVQEAADTGNVMTIDGGTGATTTLEQLNNAINNGTKAHGHLHFGGGVALPSADDTVTIGDQSWTWREITGNDLPATAQGFADALAPWITNHSDKYIATASASGTGATVQIEARAVGKAGNVDIKATNANSGVDITDSMIGGLDGTKTVTTGKIYGTGTSTLRLSTDIHATVLDVNGEDVTLRLSWYDDYGKLHEQDATIEGSGEDNFVEVVGMGGLRIYRDDFVFNEGAKFNISVGHDQGNSEKLAINYANMSNASDTHRLSYNWTQEEIIGGHLSRNLLGIETLGKENTGTGKVYLAGSYQGLTIRDLNFDVISEGQAPDTPPKFRVSWTDDNGQKHTEEIEAPKTGQSNAIEIPNCNGVKFYIDQGDFKEGDGFYYRINKNQVSVIDTMMQWQYQLSYGNELDPQTTSQETLQALDLAMKNILDFVGEAGSLKQRVTLRETVLTDQTTFHTTTLKNLQEVDLEEAFLKLRQSQSTYDKAIKTFAKISQLSLVSMM